MKLILLSLLCPTVAAFTSSSSRTSPTSLAASPSPFANEIGAQAPLGYFDPLRICADGNKAQFERLRYVELKHGRIAMLAVVGYLTTYAGVRFPGAEDIPAGFAALQNLPTGVWAQMFLTIGVMEAFNRDASDIWPDAPASEFPGDFRNGFLDFGWDKQTDAWKEKKRAIELNQGRAAQMGILSLMVHDSLGNVQDILP